MKLTNILAASLLLTGNAFSAYAVPAVDADGLAVLPYFEDFQNEESLGLLDIIDANNDGRTWYYSDIVFDIRNRASDETDSDDWLLLPPMHMEKDKSYRLTFKTRAVYSMYTERLEVMLASGREASAEAMKTVLIPAEDIVLAKEMGVTVTVPEDGVYRIGFHAISPKGAFRLALDDILVDSPRSAHRPGLPSDAVAETIEEGKLMARVRFTAPDKTVNGSPLGSVDRILIRVNGNQTAEISDAVPGKAYSVDVPTSQGVNDFEIVAVNSEGEGEPALVRLFTGDDVPLPPANVVMDVRDGKAYLSWEAPQQGENGGFIDPGTLTYEIQRRSDFQYIEENFSGTEYVDVLPDNINSRPRQLFYCIRAISKGGKSIYAGDSNRFITGDAYTLPFAESFAGTNYDDGHYWHSINDGERWNLDATLVYDNDGGAAKFAPANMGENSLFYTSRIDLRGTENPLLTFHYWHVKNSDMILEVQVSRENGPFETVRTLDFAEDSDPAGWKKGAVLLSDFTDAEYVLVGWKATAGGIQTVTALDAVELSDVPSADLSVTLSAPEKAAENQPVMMTAKVSNIGARDAVNFRIRLHHEALGLVEEKTCDMLAVGMEREFEFSLPFHVTPGLRNGAYTVETVWEDDIDFSNDKDRRVVELRAGRLPKPSGLKAVKEDDRVVLNWERPALEGRITDDMEDYEAFLTSDFGDWITIDRDRQPTYRIVEAQIDEDNEQIGTVTLEYPNAGGEMAFQVFNPVLAGSSFAEGMCHSGNQLLASFAAVKGRNDDWLISPELSGEAQTISFQARSGGDRTWGQEEFEVWVSDRLQSPEGFSCVLPATKVPNEEWKEINVDLPEGTRHFAIHCTSQIVMTLFIDDVSFIPVACSSVLEGYDIYRDNMMIGHTETGSECFTDTEADSNSLYTVRAVYDNGTSLPCVAVKPVEGSAVDSLHEEGAHIHVTPGMVSVTSPAAACMMVHALDGTMLAKKDNTDHADFRLDKGVYVVTVDGCPTKVLVP